MDTKGQRRATELLQAWNAGDISALDQLIPDVHAELHRIARGQMMRERPNHTLQPSALINEAYLRLGGYQRVRWQNRTQFFAIAAQLMRRILVDHARARNSIKRGGAEAPLMLQSEARAAHKTEWDLIALNEAMSRLAGFDPRKNQIVELRVFGGLTMPEIAEFLGISEITVKREWKFALAWLRQEMEQFDDS
jgi:RNA polymerase sigma factor (TIGR02999 family)